MAEEEWWDKHNRIAEKFWVFTPKINQSLRKEHLNDMYNFLYKEDGKLLDVGCGTGWLSLKFAETGMNVVGIDISKENLKVARSRANKANIHNLTFEQVDLLKFNPDRFNHKFDSILIYALLHHLPENLGDILPKIKRLSKEGGKIYIYEPIIYGRKSRLMLIYTLPFVLLKKLIYNAKVLLDADVREIVKFEINTSSPDERPLDPEEFEKLLKEYFIIQDIEYSHMMSLYYAIICVSVKKNLQKILIPFIKPLLHIERKLLKIKSFRERTNSWILTSYKCLNQGENKNES